MFSVFAEIKQPRTAVSSKQRTKCTSHIKICCNVSRVEYKAFKGVQHKVDTRLIQNHNLTEVILLRRRETCFAVFDSFPCEKKKTTNLLFIYEAALSRTSR